MTSLTIELEDAIVERLRQFAAKQRQSEADVIRAALLSYVQGSRPMPIGIGKYQSGKSDVSLQARNLIRAAIKEGQWP